MKPPIIKLLKPALRKQFHVVKANLRREESCMAAVAGILREAPEMLPENHPYHLHRLARDEAKKRIQSYRMFGLAKSLVWATQSRVWLNDKVSVYLPPHMNEWQHQMLVYGSLFQLSAMDHVPMLKLSAQVIKYHRLLFKVKRPPVRKPDRTADKIYLQKLELEAKVARRSKRRKVVGPIQLELNR